MAKNAGTIYQLEIWLADVEPRVWRKFEVDAAIRLDKLHDVIQDVMGWTNTHLHSFIAGDDEYSVLDPDDDMDDTMDERKGRLSDLVRRPRERFIYTYDYGDNWEHVVELVEIKEPQKGVKYPVCLDGRRACPPEDCGGALGYEELLEILDDPDHEEHEDRLEWLGGEFDPEAFDIKEVNDALKG
ncbi:MAG: plasmid pRiA4b ORF-3 family protein [Planctomycetaceae bacterium]|nr:plasmid pRiA4b ORF-3 family protein [Planctomycetaceae bacterium]